VLDKLAIARALREMGELLAFKGENPFRARAYETGARALEGVTEDLGRLVDEGRLTGVRGIGEGLAAVIAELHLTGRSAQLERLRAELPPGVLELSQVPGLTPRRVRALHAALGIGSIAELEAAGRAGRLRGVAGIGEKTERKILDGIVLYQTRAQRLLLVDALPLARELGEHLGQLPGVTRVEAAGALRRRAESVGELVLVVATDDAGAALDGLGAFPRVARVERRDPDSCAVRLASGLAVELHAVAPVDFAAALHRWTGSEAHRQKLGALAAARGVSLDAPAASEPELYRRLDLPYLAPELREDAGELEAALGGERFDDLVETAQLRGVVHCHTTWSDGRNSVEEMARAADALGLGYLTITDHSPSAYYASGVGLDRLRAQWDEIARVQERVKVRLLRGTESDILESGALDYPDAILEQLDVVIASIHSRMKMDSAQMTRRLVTAMQLPLFKIWGHPLGRLVEQRPPIDCRVEEVLDAVAGARAAVEINGDPYRLDLEPRWLREARRRRIRFVVSVDAHSVRALENLSFGVAMARRGGVRRGEVLNTLDADAFAAAVKPA
jgi:DNA polymerase (family 10)